MKTRKKGFFNPLKVKELRRKMLLIIGVMFIIRLLNQIPTPGVNHDYLKQILGGSGAMGFMDLMTGGSLSSLSILALNISPYITASIVIELLSIVFKQLDEMKRDGKHGQEELKKITLYSAIGLSFIQALAMSVGFGRKGMLTHFTWYWVLIITLIWTASAGALAFVGNYMTEKKLCNGVSLILALMRNKEIKKEIRELKRKMKGLPSAGGESWKDAVGEYNRLQEEDAVVRMSLKQVPASDSYQLDFLNKKAKEIESRKRKAKDILSGIENGIKEREKLTVLLETKNSMLEEDVTVLFREAYDALSVYGDIYIETDEKGRALCQIAESDSLPCIREIRETDGIKYIPGTAADVLDIIDQCSFRYEPEDWTVGRSAEEEIKTGIARLKAGGCTWTSLYNTRLEAEIEMLRKTDTEGYFLTVCDILRLAEEYYPSDPFYPGLLVSYVLGITDIDPVCNDILTKLSEETFVAGIHHPRFMIRSELSDSLYKKIREKYAVSRISKDTIVIGYPDIRDYVPVCRDRIQCDRDEAEKMGLFCMDLEEQEYLSIFKECISSIQDPGIPIDSEVFKNVIAKGHLNFICGCEGMEIQKQIRQSHPESIRELVSFFSSTCEKAEAFYRALFVYRSAYLKYRFPLNYILCIIKQSIQSLPRKIRMQNSSV